MKKIWIRILFMLKLYIKFQDPSSNNSCPYTSVTERQMDGQAKSLAPTLPSTSSKLSWGHNIVI